MPPPPDPDLVLQALAASGQLRECVVAARNLEHLVGSLTVGAQVLSQVIPDVAELLARLRPYVGEALDCIQLAGIDLSAAERSELFDEAFEGIDSLLGLLRQMSSTPLNAKARLALDHELSKAVPLLVTTVAHLELLLEVCQTASSDMTVFELLTSIPERGSDRPYRPLPVGGAGLERWVSIPPRVGLKVLSAWSARLSPDDSERGVVVGGDAQRVEFAVAEVAEPALVVRLPVFFPAASTGLVVQAVLRPFGGYAQGPMLSLPVKA